MWDFEIDETVKEIFPKYKYALKYIGVDFEREDVQETLTDCVVGMEEAFQATIGYWFWTKKNNLDFEHPSAFLIKAINNQWKPINWDDDYLNNPNFKSLGMRWLEKASKVLGTEKINYLVADISENKYGQEYIFFGSGKSLSVDTANRLDLEKILNEYS